MSATGPGKVPSRGRVLVVEDEAYVRDSLTEILRERGYDIVEAGTVGDAVRVLAHAPIDVVLTDFRLPGADGLALVKQIQSTSPDVPVVVLTGQGTIASAVECLKSGASDYLLKPADPEALEVALERALAGRALRREVQYLRAAGREIEPLGQTLAWRRALEMTDAAAASDAIVLLRGESGTGKDLLARRLHQKSRRAAGPYIRVNGAAVPLELWESEFFGHRRGSFTGASADREGWFQLAHRGTLFLDEVGAIPLAAQPKLLRAIQDGEFHRLGEQQPTRVDVRIVAATNADLESGIKDGRFRADLYYRLNVLQIRVPPLRERPDDIAVLAGAFAADVAARLGRPAPDLDEETLARLASYPWPGNVRELRSVIERALILHPGRGLAALDLAPEPVAPSPATDAAPGGPSAPDDLTLRESLNRLERSLLVEAHRRAHGVRREAARLLGIDARNLAYYCRKHGLDPDTLAE
ncbi:MAG TPA: sigma-54 dependent transcriptional regulator [Vicinamibacteria bacterium]|nr:sigma-54 dependent transcriptional regulator [Vicinamibacteria bacterium]